MHIGFWPHGLRPFSLLWGDRWASFKKLKTVVNCLVAVKWEGERPLLCGPPPKIISNTACSYPAPHTSGNIALHTAFYLGVTGWKLETITFRDFPFEMVIPRHRAGVGKLGPNLACGLFLEDSWTKNGFLSIWKKMKRRGIFRDMRKLHEIQILAFIHKI